MYIINSLSDWEKIKESGMEYFSKRIAIRIEEITHSEVFENGAGTIYIYFKDSDDEETIQQQIEQTEGCEDFILYDRQDNTFVSAFSKSENIPIWEQLKEINKDCWLNEYDYEFFFIPENDIAEIIFVL